MIPYPLIGKLFIITGIVIVVVGLWMLYGPKIPVAGRLPGDLIIQKKNFTLYFPITTLIILNLIILFLFYIFKK